MYFEISFLLIVLGCLYQLLNKIIFNNNTEFRISGPSLNLFNKIHMMFQYLFLYTVPEFTENWLSKYGKTVRVYMLGETILTSDHCLIRDILIGPNSKFFISRMGNSDGLKKIGMFNKGIIWNNDKNKWKVGRNAFDSNFTSEFLKKTVYISQEKIMDEISKLNQSDKIKCVKNGYINYEINIMNFFRKITLSIVLEVCFGVRISDNEKDLMIKSIIDYFKAWEFFLLKSNLTASIFFPILHQKHKRAVTNLNQNISNFIDKYLKDFEQTPFLLSLKKSNLSDEEIQQNVLEMILAGTDTSSVSLYYTILLLTENKPKYELLVESLNNDTNLRYIDLVLKESLRILPVGPVIIRQAIDECFLNGDIKIRKGTNIIMHLARMNRDEEIFKNPLNFEPERFNYIENEKEKFFPMGKGPKSCVGQYFAMTEMKQILSEFIKSYYVLRKTNEQCIKMKTKWDIAQQPILEEHVALLPIKHCILVGSNSVGKTTLAKYFSDKIGCKISSEIARDVIQKMNLINGKKIKTDPKVCFNIQKEIIKKLAEIETNFKNQLVVYDRCAVDALVYAKYFTLENEYEELLNMDETKYLIRQYKSDSLVFLIKPNEKFLKDDGFRLMPENVKEWYEFSEMFEKIMTHLNIDYYIIDKEDLNDRFIQIMEKLSL